MSLKDHGADLRSARRSPTHLPHQSEGWKGYPRGAK